MKNNSKTITNEHDKEIPKERHISLKERQKIMMMYVKCITKIVKLNIKLQC